MPPRARSKRREYMLDWVVTPATAHRYKRSVIEFLQWIDDNGDDARDVKELDDLLLDYIHELYENGSGKAKAISTYYGVIMYAPRLKFELIRSKQAVYGWSKRMPSQARPPITWELAVVTAVQLVRIGKYRYGVGVLVAFDCLLRVGELTGIRREDVADSEDLRIGVEHKGMVLRLRKTKTGPEQGVSVLNPDVCQLLRDLVKVTPAKGYLFPFRTDSFRRVLKAVWAQLDLSADYTPHSLRHGGATRYHHVKGMSMEDILQRGRWSSTESARRYIQSGRALLMAQAAPKLVLQLGLTMSKDLLLYMTLAQKH